MTMNATRAHALADAEEYLKIERKRLEDTERTSLTAMARVQCDLSHAMKALDAIIEAAWYDHLNRRVVIEELALMETNEGRAIFRTIVKRSQSAQSKAPVEPGGVRPN